MFDKPTINDFLDLLRTDTNRAVEVLGRETDALGRRFNADGMYRSGGMIKALLEAAETAFRNRLDAALISLRQALQNSDIDPRELRDTAFQHLQQLPHLIRNASGVDRVSDAVDSDSVRGVVDGHFAKITDHLRYQFRQFNIGWAGKEEVEGDSFVNSGTIIGGVQQRSPGASISVEVTVNVEAARHAADALAQELAAAPQKAPIIDMRADVDTLRAQLRKETPSATVLGEAGRTLRSVAEGVGAGLLTPAAAAAVVALMKALGLG